MVKFVFFNSIATDPRKINKGLEFRESIHTMELATRRSPPPKFFPLSTLWAITVTLQFYPLGGALTMKQSLPGKQNYHKNLPSILPQSTTFPFQSISVCFVLFQFVTCSR